MHAVLVSKNAIAFLFVGLCENFIPMLHADGMLQMMDIRTMFCRQGQPLSLIKLQLSTPNLSDVVKTLKYPDNIDRY